MWKLRSIIQSSDITMSLGENFPPVNKRLTYIVNIFILSNDLLMNRLSALHIKSDSIEVCLQAIVM